jgi:hypothetical protein
VSITVNRTKRKIDEVDPGVYLNVPLAKKKKLISLADHAVVITSTNGELTVIDLTEEDLAKIYNDKPAPDIDSLLGLKDDLCIPDAKWATILETFHLSDKCSIYYIRKRRNELNNILPITRTAGNGRKQDLENVLGWMLKKDNIDPNIPTRIKFAFDGARIAAKQKQMQVVGTVEVLKDKTLAQIKSPDNAHQYIIYIGDETNEDLKRELGDDVQTLQSIFKDRSVRIFGRLDPLN